MYEVLAIMFRSFTNIVLLLANNCQSLALAFFGLEIIASDSEIIASHWHWRFSA
jgi:hypothetical protein